MGRGWIFISRPKKTNFQKIGSSHFETLGLKVCLVTSEQFIAFRNVPLEFLVNYTKITFYDQIFFLNQNCTSIYLSHFYLKEKFLCLIFLTCHLKDDCSNPPGGLTLLKLSPLWKKVKTRSRKVWGLWLKGFRVAANNQVLLDKNRNPVGNKVNTKGRIRF